MSYIPQGSVEGGIVNVSAQVIIDCLNTGNTTIFTVPAGKVFVPTFVSTKLGTVSAIITPPVAAIGGNSASFNNIIAALNPLTVLNEGFSDVCNNVAVFQDAGTDVKVRVSVAAVAGSYNLQVVLIGYLI